jgi:hypothetical protein
MLRIRFAIKEDVLGNSSAGAQLADNDNRFWLPAQGSAAVDDARMFLPCREGCLEVLSMGGSDRRNTGIA